MKQRYVEIAKFDSWADADIFRNRLIAKGIRAMLSGPNTSATFGMYMGEVSKVSVMVPQSSVGRIERDLLEDAVPDTTRRKARGRSSPPPTPFRKKAKGTRK